MHSWTLIFAALMLFLLASEAEAKKDRRLQPKPEEDNDRRNLQSAEAEGNIAMPKRNPAIPRKQQQKTVRFGAQRMKIAKTQRAVTMPGTSEATSSKSTTVQQLGSQTAAALTGDEQQSTGFWAAPIRIWHLIVLALLTLIGFGAFKLFQRNCSHKVSFSLDNFGMKK